VAFVFPDAAYQQVRGKVDVNFADMGEQRLKNIAHPVRVYRLVDAASTTTASQVALPLPDKPSIAVLPFQNMSGDPEQEHFSDGIAEDIITMLSHSRCLFVIARNSSFTYKGRAVDVKQVSRELGVRYLLEGSVRRAGSRVRVSAQLVDADTGSHLWAERYDRDVTDVFAVQDEITDAVAAAIEPRVAEMERQRAVRRPPESMGAWEAYQRGSWHISQMSAADHEKAKQFFQRAIDLDPNFGAAYSALAVATMTEAILYQTRGIGEAVQEATAYAQRGIALDPMDAHGHCCMGDALMLQGDYEGALAEARRALSISPNLAPGHVSLGAALLFSGRPREAIGVLRQALRQDPYDPFRFFRLGQIGTGHYFLREYNAAVEVLKETIRSYPHYPWLHYRLAAALGQLGRVGEAQAALQKAIAIAPQSMDMFVRHRLPWVRPEDHEHLLDGLRKAGWGE
jgi:adenylate cyclase